MHSKGAAISDFLRRNVILITLIAVMVLFQVITDGLFLGARNLSNLLRQTSIIGVVTMSMLMLIIAGKIDLACGMSVALCGGMVAIAMVRMGLPITVSVLLSVLLGALIGLWQGMWVAKGGLVPFICTLADKLLFQGLYLTIIQGKTIGPVSSGFKQIAQGYLPAGFAWALCAVVIAAILVNEVMKRKKILSYGLEGGSLGGMLARILVYCALVVAICWRLCQHQGVPVLVLIMFGFVLLTGIILGKTRFGRRVYAIGGNTEAAKLSGINIEKYTIALYVIAGVFAAVAGCMLVARLDGATNTAGTNYETDAISACVIGGASMNGGIGTVFGAVVGILLIAALENGMGLLNISTYVQYIVKGLVLLAAVWFDIRSRRAGKN